MTVVFALTGALLTLSALLVVYRLLRGPTLHDRVASVDTIVVLVITGIALQAAVRGEGGGVALLLVVALVGFLSSASVVRLLGDDQAAARTEPDPQEEPQ